MAIASLLHVGVEHPNLIWILVPALATFAMGIGVGMYTMRKRAESADERTAVEG